MCFIDYDRQMAIVVEEEQQLPGERQILGVGRLIRIQARMTRSLQFSSRMKARDRDSERSS